MKYSIVCGYRNRGLDRVRISIDSLAQQTLKDFEFIFVDYGSNQMIASCAQILIESYPFARYVYNDTRGWFWSRAHAFNSGIALAKGEISILWDIDLIVEPDFLERLDAIDFNGNFTTHHCYYLPEIANVNNYKTREILRKSQHSYVGLSAIKTAILKSINGFDEFYHVWGAEDDDIINRLIGLGLIRSHIDATEIVVYHQWHQTQAPSLPDMWYIRMVEYLFQPSRLGPSFGRIFSCENRPALVAFQERTYRQFKEIQFDMLHSTLMYNELIREFQDNEEDKCFYIDFMYSQLDLSKMAQGIIRWFNLQMENRSLNFRLINKKLQDRNQLKDNIYSFLKYFICTNCNKYTDYYLDWRENGFVLILIK